MTPKMTMTMIVVREHEEILDRRKETFVRSVNVRRARTIGGSGGASTLPIATDILSPRMSPPSAVGSSPGASSESRPCGADSSGFSRSLYSIFPPCKRFALTWLALALLSPAGGAQGVASQYVAGSNSDKIVLPPYGMTPRWTHPFKQCRRVLAETVRCDLRESNVKWTVYAQSPTAEWFIMPPRTNVEICYQRHSRGCSGGEFEYPVIETEVANTCRKLYRRSSSPQTSSRTTPKDRDRRKTGRVGKSESDNGNGNGNENGGGGGVERDANEPISEAEAEDEARTAGFGVAGDDFLYSESGTRTFESRSVDSVWSKTELLFEFETLGYQILRLANYSSAAAGLRRSEHDRFLANGVPLQADITLRDFFVENAGFDERCTKKDFIISLHLLELTHDQQQLIDRHRAFQARSSGSIPKSDSKSGTVEGKKKGEGKEGEGEEAGDDLKGFQKETAGGSSAVWECVEHARDMNRIPKSMYKEIKVKVDSVDDTRASGSIVGKMTNLDPVDLTFPGREQRPRNRPRDYISVKALNGCSFGTASQAMANIEFTVNYPIPYRSFHDNLRVLDAHFENCRKVEKADEIGDDDIETDGPLAPEDDPFKKLSPIGKRESQPAGDAPTEEVQRRQRQIERLPNDSKMKAMGFSGGGIRASPLSYQDYGEIGEVDSRGFLDCPQKETMHAAISCWAHPRRRQKCLNGTFVMKAEKLAVRNVCELRMPVSSPIKPMFTLNFVQRQQWPGARPPPVPYVEEFTPRPSWNLDAFEKENPYGQMEELNDQASQKIISEVNEDGDFDDYNPYLDRELLLGKPSTPKGGAPVPLAFALGEQKILAEREFDVRPSSHRHESFAGCSPHDVSYEIVDEKERACQWRFPGLQPKGQSQSLNGRPPFAVGRDRTTTALEEPGSSSVGSISSTSSSPSSEYPLHLMGFSSEPRRWERDAQSRLTKEELREQAREDALYSRSSGDIQRDFPPLKNVTAPQFIVIAPRSASGCKVADLSIPAWATVEFQASTAIKAVHVYPQGPQKKVTTTPVSAGGNSRGRPRELNMPTSLLLVSSALSALLLPFAL